MMDHLVEVGEVVVPRSEKTTGEKRTASGNKRKPTQCGNCLEFGHNARTCKRETVPLDKVIKRKAMSEEVDVENGSMPPLKRLRTDGGKVKTKKSGRKKAKKRGVKKFERERPWPIPKVRMTGQHYPHKVEFPRMCTWCFNRRHQKRQTKYSCPDCKVELCAAPCFEEFHTLR